MTATMVPLVDIVIEDPRWSDLDLEPLADRAAGAALAVVGLPADGFEISLLACDDARIAVLNADFRGKAQATNVLSWPSEERGAEEPGGAPLAPETGTPDDPEELGDIAIAWDTCAREAEAAGTPMADHVTHLLIHATLHLLGYDHVTDPDAEVMEGLEVRAMTALGLANPYA